MGADQRVVTRIESLAAIAKIGFTPALPSFAGRSRLGASPTLMHRRLHHDIAGIAFHFGLLVVVSAGCVLSAEVKEMPEVKTWVVTTSGNRSIADIRKDLENAGLTHVEILDQIGVITGSADDSALDRLRTVPGVGDVSPSEPINIGPPNARETW
jgi:hypothetical protein